MSNPNPTRLHPRQPLFWLPSELVLMVTDLLPISDSICLALTCHHMHGEIDKEPWNILHATKQDDPEQGTLYYATGLESARWDVLTNLEGKLPGLELCHFCRILHPRVSDGSETLLRPVDTDSPGLECNAKDFAVGRWSVWGLGFMDVHAVMSHHLLKGRCGLPLSHLRFSTDWAFADVYKKIYCARRAPFKEFLSYFKLDTDAIIDDNQLIVHRTQRLWVPVHEQGTDVLLRYGIGDIANDLRICSHFTVKSPDMIRRFVIPFGNALKLVVAAEKVRGPGTRPEDVFQRPLLTQCEECPTQFQTSFHVHNDGNKSIEIVVDVWQNLGGCRSPEDPGWIGCWGHLNPRYRDIRDSQLRLDWRRSGAKHPTPSQRDSLRSLTGKTHPSSSIVTDHWKYLSTFKNSCTGHPSHPSPPAPAVSVSAWEPLTPKQFDALLRGVELAMIG